MEICLPNHEPLVEWQEFYDIEHSQAPSHFWGVMSWEIDTVNCLDEPIKVVTTRVVISASVCWDECDQGVHPVSYTLLVERLSGQKWKLVATERGIWRKTASLGWELFDRQCDFPSPGWVLPGNENRSIVEHLAEMILVHGLLLQTPWFFLEEALECRLGPCTMYLYSGSTSGTNYDTETDATTSLEYYKELFCNSPNQNNTRIWTYSSYEDARNAITVGLNTVTVVSPTGVIDTRDSEASVSYVPGLDEWWFSLDYVSILLVTPPHSERLCYPA